MHRYGKLVAFSHSVFALPFALSMYVIVSARYGFNVLQLVWIVMAVVAARTAAMSFNRLADAEIDARNPRTANREIPAGVVSKKEALTLTIAASLVFLVSSALLGTHCLVLAPIVLGILLYYSISKRYTWTCHLILGLSLAMAPGGVWYALTARFAWEPVILMAAVLLWVAGFDLIYACQDVEFDQTNHLSSIPARFGVKRALLTARLFHLGATLMLVAFGFVMHEPVFYFIGTAVFALLMLSQHRKVSVSDLSAVNRVFFTRNGIASVVYFVCVLLGVIIVP